MLTAIQIAALCMIAIAGADTPGDPVAPGRAGAAQAEAPPRPEVPLVPLERGARGLGGGAAGRAAALYFGAYAPRTLLDGAQAAAPLHVGERDAFALTVSAGALQFLDPVARPGGATPMPSEIYEIGLGAGYARRLEGARAMAARVQVGSPSDEPFSSWSVVAYRAGLEVSFPSGEHGRWIVALVSSNNTGLVDYVPLPGVAYAYRGESVAALVGLPIASVQWWPGRWTLSAFAGPRTIEAEAAYGERRGLQGFTRFAAAGQTYLLAHRPDTSQRLFLDEQRAAAGLRFPLPGPLSAELQGGYAYARELYQASKAALVFAGAGDPKTRLPSGWFMGWTLRLVY